MQVLLASAGSCWLLLAFAESFLPWPLVRLAKSSPNGESLSFVSAKESNQRKTDGKVHTHR